MRLCDVGSLTVVTALATAVWFGHAPMPLVLLVAAAGAVISSVYAPAVFGLMRAVVPADQMGTATARLQARSQTARLVGPLVGGALFGIHPALPFAAEALGLLLSTVCVALVRTRSRARAKAGAVFSRRELLAGLTFLWGLPYLRTVLLVFGLGMNFAFGALTFTALTAFSDGGTSGIGGGFVITCVSAGALAGALIAPRISPERHSRLLIVATCWTCVTAAGVMAWAGDAPGRRADVRALHVSLDRRQHRLPLETPRRDPRGPGGPGPERGGISLLDGPAVRTAGRGSAADRTRRPRGVRAHRLRAGPVRPRGHARPLGEGRPAPPRKAVPADAPEPVAGPARAAGDGPVPATGPDHAPAVAKRAVPGD